MKSELLQVGGLVAAHYYWELVGTGKQLKGMHVHQNAIYLLLIVNVMFPVQIKNSVLYFTACDSADYF